MVDIGFPVVRKMDLGYRVCPVADSKHLGSCKVSLKAQAVVE